MVNMFLYIIGDALSRYVLWAAAFAFTNPKLFILLRPTIYIPWLISARISRVLMKDVPPEVAQSAYLHYIQHSVLEGMSDDAVSLSILLIEGGELDSVFSTQKLRKESLLELLKNEHFIREHKKRFAESHKDDQVRVD